VLFAMGALWSLASPVFSVADEPGHVVRAAAVVRGQLGGRDSTAFVDHQVRTEVRVPLIFATATSLPACYIGRTGESAGCAPPFAGPKAPGPVLTQVGRYPPTYYALVGLPGRWWPSVAGVHSMRLLSAALAAALLASAFTSLRDIESGSAVLLGVAAAVTPMVVFLAGSVNPSALELAAAVGLWTAATGLLLGHREGTAGRFAARAAVAGSALLLSRQLGPVMAGLILVVMAVVAGPERLRLAAARHEVRRAAVVLGVVALASVAWILGRHTLSGVGGTPPPTALSLKAVVQMSFGQTPRNLLQMIGSFGWTDTAAPTLTYLLWFGCLGFLTFAALAVAGRREAAGLALLVALVVALPVALESSRAREIGFVWLGRYTLPLAAGLPILAARLGAPVLRAAGRRLTPLFVAALAVAHLLAFVWALKRYTHGFGFGAPDPWAPPGSTPVLILVFAVASAAYGWWLTRLARAAAP
jgi:hypothetical protein